MNVIYLLKSYYWEKVAFSKLRFSKFKKFAANSVFGELQLTISLNFENSCWNLKIRGLEQNWGWLFNYFSFERNYDILKSKCLCIFLNKNINFNKNETELKTQNSMHSFREANLVPKGPYKNRTLKVKLW